MCVFVFVCSCQCVYLYTSTHIHTCIHAYITCTCTYTYVHACMHACIHTYIPFQYSTLPDITLYTNVHTYMHTYIQTDRQIIHYIQTYIHTYIHTYPTYSTAQYSTAQHSTVQYSADIQTYRHTDRQTIMCKYCLICTMYSYMYVHMVVCLHKHICIHICIYVYMYRNICTYIHAHTILYYIHTQRFLRMCLVFLCGCTSVDDESAYLITSLSVYTDGTQAWSYSFLRLNLAYLRNLFWHASSGMLAGIRNSIEHITHVSRTCRVAHTLLDPAMLKEHLDAGGTLLLLLFLDEAPSRPHTRN